jgi:HK97 family phage prohead protease
MTIKRKFLAAETQTLADQRQVRVVCSTDQVDRAGEVIVQTGIDLGDYLANPIVLWQHDPEQPIARALDIGIVAGKLQALVQFPDAGVSAKADEVYGLIKAGVVNATSIGFDPVECEPMDPSRPRGPQRYSKSGLMEFSFVSVPANPGASIIARAAGDKEPNWKCGASRNLPIDMDSAWDGPEAEGGIFGQADFESDSPDTTFARKGFLAYDSGNPDLKGSYKLPFAKVVDGRLTAFASGIRAAASRLPQADLPEDVATKARAVLDFYEGKMKEKATGAAVTKDVKPMKVKDLYDVAQLAYLLNSLGYIEDSAEWEAEIEGDGSKVPAMLGAAMQQLGAALIAMTQEEVAELLGEEAGDGTVAKTVKPLVKAISEARVAVKAGRVLSAASTETIKSAMDGLDAALGKHGDGAEHITSAKALLADLVDSAATVDTTADPGQGQTAPEDKSADAARQKRQREIEIMRLKAAS